MNGRQGPECLVAQVQGERMGSGLQSEAWQDRLSEGEGPGSEHSLGGGMKHSWNSPGQMSCPEAPMLSPLRHLVRASSTPTNMQSDQGTFLTSTCS